MKDQAIVCNIGHFDNEIDVASLKQYQREEIKRRLITSSSLVWMQAGQAHHPARAGRLVNLGCAPAIRAT